MDWRHSLSTITLDMRFWQPRWLLPKSDLFHCKDWILIIDHLSTRILRATYIITADIVYLVKCLASNLKALIFHFKHPTGGGSQCLTLSIRPVSWTLGPTTSSRYMHVGSFIIQDHIMESFSSLFNNINQIAYMVTKDDVIYMVPNSL